MLLSHCLYNPITDTFSIEAPHADCVAEAMRRNASIAFANDNPGDHWIVVPAESKTLGSIEAIVATEAK